MTPLLDDPFSEAPKTSIESLYDREAELKALKNALKRKSRMVLVLGVRRVGKTSLLKAGLNSMKTPYVFLDLRALASYDDKSLYSILVDELNRVMPFGKRLLEQLKKVKGVSVGVEGVSISLAKDKPGLTSIFRALDRWASEEKFCLPVVFDEAQELRFFQGGRRRFDFRRFLAYSYDNLQNITLILSGSEVGLLLRLLGFDDPKSPLFGRHYERIVVERLDRAAAYEFLRLGFEHHGIEVEDEVLRQVVERLDGIIGWLAHFGAEAVREYRRGSGVNIIELIQVIESKAVALCASELEEVAKRSTLYIAILAELKDGVKTWSELKSALEKRLKRVVSNPQLANLLNTLSQLSLIEKTASGYRALDPLAPEAAELLLSRRWR